MSTLRAQQGSLPAISNSCNSYSLNRMSQLNSAFVYSFMLPRTLQLGYVLAGEACAGLITPIGIPTTLG